MPARSLRACVTWLPQRPCRRWRVTRRSASASWWRRATRSPTTSRSRATARLCRGTSRLPSASSATTPRRCSSSTRSGRRARRSSPPSSRAHTSRSSGSRSRPMRASAPSWPGRSFLCRLWTDSTDFSLDGDRLAEAIAELEAGGETRDDEIEVVVPLRGLQMPVVRLELATATIVRADTVEVPAEARASEGAGAAGWEPTFLAAARVSASETSEEDAESERRTPAPVPVEAFRQLITALRLFQAGGVGLGPYAWTRAGADRWRRIATGAGRPRRGGYRLAEDELGDLTTLSRVLAYRSTPFGRPGQDGPGVAGAVARAISRFEAGLERNVVLEALNDYLLALRFVLEGGGPADLGLSMRVAALCAEPERRAETKAIVDRALALERELWSGEPAPAAEGGPTAAETAVAIEDLTRAILRDAACGHLGSDLRATADEILLADGLAVGRGRGRAARRRRGVGPADRAGRRRGADRRRGARRERRVGARLRGAVADRPRRCDRASRRTPCERAAVAGRLRRLARGRRGPRRRRGCRSRSPQGRIRIESRPQPEEENVFAQQTRPGARSARRPLIDAGERSRGPRRRAARGAPAGARADGRPRRLSLPAPRDHRVGRARAELRPPPARRPERSVESPEPVQLPPPITQERPGLGP